jgi:hypothetical protein
MTNRAKTDELADALKRAGLKVQRVVRRTDAGDSDLIYLSDDQYVAVDYEDADRIGVIGVDWRTEMHSGGHPTHESWLMPATSPDAIAAELAAAL